MRKGFMAALVFAGTLAFTACNNEEIVVQNNGTEVNGEMLLNGEGIIEIGVSNTGVGSRATRPVGSSAAANNVDRVKLVAYKLEDGKWVVATGVSIEKVYVYEGNDVTTDGNSDAKVGNMEFKWGRGPQGEDAPTTDRTAKQKIKLTGLAKNTTYKFVAYGYNTSDAYGFTDKTETDGIDLTSANALDKFAIEEVFAGTTGEAETDANGKFSKYIDVTMERQVAGMLAYFENVPTKIDGEQVKTIRVVANNRARHITIPFTTDFNGSDMIGQEDELLVFKLDEIATNYSNWENDDYYTFTDLSTTGYAKATAHAPFADGYATIAPKGLKLKANTIFGARFVLPYDNHYASQTLWVEMLNENDEVLKKLNITTGNKPSDETANQYDIRRNNFYSIGKKLLTDSTEGPTTDPEEPGTDPDKPIDLSKNTDITVIINDAWEVLHDMGVED